MPYTVSEVESMLARRLRDAFGEKFTASSGIKLEAINSAVRDIVFYTLSLSAGDSKSRSRAYSLLKELNTVDPNISIPSSGIDINSFSNRFNTLINIYVKPVSEQDAYWAVIRDITAIGRSQNMWLHGNSKYPVCYINANKIYVEVDYGDYPVLCDVYYIRDPKEMVTTTPSGYQTDQFELSDKFINITLDLAQKYCYAASSDLEQYKIFAQEAVEKFLIMNNIRRSQPVEASVGQASRTETDKDLPIINPIALNFGDKK